MCSVPMGTYLEDAERMLEKTSKRGAGTLKNEWLCLSYPKKLSWGSFLSFKNKNTLSSEGEPVDASLLNPLVEDCVPWNGRALSPSLVLSTDSQTSRGSV